MISRLVSVVSLAILASVAAAQDYPYWDLKTTLDFSVDRGLAAQGVVVSHIIAYTEGRFTGYAPPAGWSTTSWAYSSDLTSSITQNYTTKYFGSELPEPYVTQSVIVGVIDGVLPDDTSTSPTTHHVVLFMNETAKAASVGQEWTSVFPSTSESDLYDDIVFAAENSTDVTGPAFGRISDFLHGEAQSVWVGPNQPLSMVSFSKGTVVGSGGSTVVSTFNPVPEPASLAALGVGALALIRRRRRA